jgi:hypothetical protein
VEVLITAFAADKTVEFSAVKLAPTYIIPPIAIDPERPIDPTPWERDSAGASGTEGGVAPSALGCAVLIGGESGARWGTG